MNKRASMHLYIYVMESVSFYKPKGKGEGTTRFIRHSIPPIPLPPPSLIFFNYPQLVSPCIEDCQQKRCKSIAVDSTVFYSLTRPG